MLWIDSVPSVRCHNQNVAATPSAYATVVTASGTPSRPCTMSAAMVPTTATIATAAQ